jgi:hypothetical protein
MNTASTTVRPAATIEIVLMAAFFSAGTNTLMSAATAGSRMIRVMGPIAGYPPDPGRTTAR